MSNQPPSGLEKLERSSPLPTISDLLAATPLPKASESDLPPLKDLLPPLAQLPKISPAQPSPKEQPKITPIPPDKSIAARVAQVLENSHKNFAQTPPPMPSSSEKSVSKDPSPFISPLPETPPTLPPSDRKKTISPEMSYPIPSPFEPKAEDLVLPDDESIAQLPPPEKKADSPSPETTSLETDEDLVEALLPIVESSLEKALYAPRTGLHTYLEPMLRSTVRRAIAEQMQTAHHFGKISAADRLTWRMKALFSSQTFDDIVFDRTHRYQVEEVFLMRYDTFSLISYASHDPSRHANAKKIRYDLSRLMGELKDDEGKLKKTFDLPEKRTALVRSGRHGFLVAVVRGRANALVRADLDYTLEQVEQRFEKRLRSEGHHFIHVLQPILESCLLIQSPAPPQLSQVGPKEAFSARRIPLSIRASLEIEQSEKSQYCFSVRIHLQSMSSSNPVTHLISCLASASRSPEKTPSHTVLNSTVIRLPSDEALITTSSLMTLRSQEPTAPWNVSTAATSLEIVIPPTASHSTAMKWTSLTSVMGTMLR
ncbi:hypothetical protein N9Z02_01100 [Akkermansiaceae bacterium]|nr:hypothetical protein [Akkermansiaceae bacterium]